MFENRQISSFLVILGISTIVLGIIYPFLEKLGMERLPGDIYLEKNGLNFYFSPCLSIVVSFIMTLIFWIISRFD